MQTKTGFVGFINLTFLLLLCFIGCDTSDGPTASNEKTINTFAIGDNECVINGETIVVTVPYATDITTLSPTITFSGKSLIPASGVEQDFTNPVIYTVTAEDGSQKSYAVVVKHAPSSAMEMYVFNIGQNVGVLSGTTVTVTAPYDTDVTKLAPTIIFSGKSVSPASGAEQDFTNPVTYTITADDNSTKSYTVTVIRHGKPSITIEFTGIADEQIDITKDSQNDLSRRNNDTLEISVDNTLMVFWFIDGAQKSGTGRTITIAAVDYPVGTHYVTAMVYRNGIPYSNELTFKVVE
jgi:hypothetical protein